jgi:hypothetical protein
MSSCSGVPTGNMALRWTMADQCMSPKSVQRFWGDMHEKQQREAGCGHPISRDTLRA